MNKETSLMLLGCFMHAAFLSVYFQCFTALKVYYYDPFSVFPSSIFVAAILSFVTHCLRDYCRSKGYIETK